ncbi:sulfite exporter TauE/SafE family protein [Roseibium litorale]|uniref:Probable membrane transporter protein n=1 Tax=Roseibium litorale TaxID=2803841 RepID=A0ABR9CS73_9HYPH|nr:sulfite exporter TauE/SafE family protein [Roseibium litorale]MBD8893690.1 sulfite exporter TauE/SafE family protein [Roseibium litorale]
MHPIADPMFYAAAIPAVLLAGLSKGGFGGSFAMLAVPLMALVISPVQAAGIMLPILVVMDIVGLLAYKGHADKRSLTILLPAAIAGIGVGWATAALVNEAFVRLLVGCLSLLFVADYLLKRHRTVGASQHNLPKGTFWGLIAGFTSFVSHTGGPPFQLYMVPLRLAPTLFAGTAVIFFSVVNAVKLVPYFLLGQFDATNLETSLVLLPLAPVATLAGVKLVKIVKQKAFYGIIYTVMVAVGIKLIWDGAASIL